MEFEERIIDTILNTIKDNQGYLTQRENLPQLAKLGYMYNTLWYGGRISSYDGIIPKVMIIDEDDDDEPCEYEQCGDNPKYKIDMCNPENEEIENYIYDAWGMHVSNGFGPSWDKFKTTVLEGKELTESEIKMLKPNKTFDEWVDALLSKKRYYTDKRHVANHLLCVIGNGYGYKNGFVIHEASGADQDSSDYGDWKNAKFREDIQVIVNQIMVDPEVEIVMEYVTKCKEDYDAKELAKEIEAFGMPYLDYLKSEERETVESVFKKLKGVTENSYEPYYPICEYSIITKLDTNSDPSYIKAGIEICEEILAHEEEESKRPENIKFAKKFLKKFKK
jgi:hypothetical protein